MEKSEPPPLFENFENSTPLPLYKSGGVPTMPPIENLHAFHSSISKNGRSLLCCLNQKHITQNNESTQPTVPALKLGFQLLGDKVFSYEAFVTHHPAHYFPPDICF